ncbi:MAG: GNAT family N-acetyltransferase [Microbacteriaceae bacterium]|nr:GNAT family N-acetyltransferase [Microbacteriaceae bacterium]
MIQTAPQTKRDTLWFGSLTTAAEYAAADELYRRVFKYTDPSFSLNANLLAAIARNGGSTVGAKDGDRLVGFAYGFSGTDGDTFFHYSQAAVVDDEYQGLGIGHRLKEAQRRVALGFGTTHMRWSFNPMYSRNGHFNFNTLGAVGAAFMEDYYGRPDSDRLIADWCIDESKPDPYAEIRAGHAVPAVGVEDWGTVVGSGAVRSVVIPGTVVAGVPRPELEPVRLRVREALSEVFAEGRVVVSCDRVSPETSVYAAVERQG